MSTLAREMIPAHLPDRLAIAFWEWMWFTDTGPDEQFHDMEKCFQELVERGFNSIRIDAMLGWIYDVSFKRRGPIKIGRIADPGYSNYSPAMTTKGDLTADAYDKIIEIFKLAQKYDIYVALTTWQYQNGHSTTFIADPTIREEIYGISLNERLLFVARQYEKLINDLKIEGLSDRIAYVEIHNEIDYVMVFEHAHQLKGLMENAIEYLQVLFPEILICSDRVIVGYKNDSDGYEGYDFNATRNFIEGFARNEQIIDHHLYAFGIQDDLFKKAGLNFPSPDNSEIDEKMNDIENNNEFFKWLMKPNYESWNQFKLHFEYPTSWRKLIYFYENVDIDRYDYWMFSNYPKYEMPMKSFWKNCLQHLYHHAKQRNLPLVCDEGYIFYPPMHSQFEISAVGKEFHEYIVNLMIKHEYWGITISTYTFPGQPLWEKEPDFLKKLNKRILDK